MKLLKLYIFLFIIILKIEISPLIASSFTPSSYSYDDESYFDENEYNHSIDNYFNDFLGWPWWGSNDDEAGDNKNVNSNPFSSSKIKGLEKELKRRIVGQDHPIQLVVNALERYAEDLNDPNAPVASLLFIGPTGVGKTQLVKELASLLLGGEEKIIRLNMSEYAEYSGVTKLIGSPPGYVDSQIGGVLTNGLKANSRTIVLFDEIEKAHPNVIKLLLQLFDEGYISDAKGNLINAKQSMFIATTNLAQNTILRMHDLNCTNEEILRAIQPTVVNELSPEVFNRLEPVLFRGLKSNIVDDLIERLLEQAAEEIFSKFNFSIKFHTSVVNFIKSKVNNFTMGARPFKRFIKESVLIAITEAKKMKYLQKNSLAVISFENNSFIIQIQNKSPFVFEWKGEEQIENELPFKLDILVELEKKLQNKVLGQEYAIQITVDSIIRYAAGLSSEVSPIGCFLYVGPTGVGKTQLAKELASELYGQSSHFIRLDMSNFSEEHSVTRIFGSPRGYIDHEKGGELTEAIKNHPYSVVLLDEIEKAHSKVLKTFLRVFDEGSFTDASGVCVDCRHVIFILTTNLGASKILSLPNASCDQLVREVRTDLIKHLSPELYNRMEIVPFHGLSADLVDQLIVNMLEQLSNEIFYKKSITINYDQSVLLYLKENGFDYQLGARPLRRLIEQVISTPIAKGIVSGRVKEGDHITVAINKGSTIISP